ncbi:hypothetical protein [Rhizobium rhizophilum]|uniref:Uncharacterized protein n=1 Tax=Rhizobium rhizophilum TaxID=1850373 RepID=A0ABY2QS59_9HYPH|nr:hypothetical protein [Rhizobium rhizophilum]THV12581.1 hypothetical protein E9677_17685 [Rhizobium rhizophilum]
MKQVFRQKPFLVLGLPMAVTALTIGLLFGALFLSAAKSDQAAIQRQRGLLNLVVGNLEEEVAHNQESATAVRYLDGVLLSELGRNYQFQDLAFTRSSTLAADVSRVPSASQIR